MKELSDYSRDWGEVMKKDINKLFANLCCSSCGADFTDESIKILREEDDFSVLQIVCSKCEKSFGIAFLGENNLEVKKNISDADLALELQDGPDAINYDNVIDAHRFIKKMGADWQNIYQKNIEIKNNLTL